MRIEITHCVDKGEIAPDGRYDFFYNFLDYLFIGDDFKVVARAYTDDIRSIAIRGATSDSDVPKPVLDYLVERFGEIKVLDTSGYRPIDPASLAENSQ